LVYLILYFNNNINNNFIHFVFFLWIKCLYCHIGLLSIGIFFCTQESWIYEWSLKIKDNRSYCGQPYYSLPKTRHKHFKNWTVHHGWCFTLSLLNSRALMCFTSAVVKLKTTARAAYPNNELRYTEWFCKRTSSPKVEFDVNNIYLEV